MRGILAAINPSNYGKEMASSEERDFQMMYNLNVTD